MRFKGWLVLCGVVWFGWWSGMGSLTATALEEEWLREAYAIRESVREEQWGQARGQLRVLAESFFVTASEAGWEPEAIEAISECIVELDQALAPASLRSVEAWDGVERLWLALDARIHPHQSMWHKYEEVLQKDLSALEEAVETGRPETIRSALDTWSHHMEQIRPALAVSFSSESTQMVEAQIEPLGDVAISDLETIHREVESWKRLLPPLFGGSEKEIRQTVNRSSPPVGASLLFLGTAIAAVLGYVAILKYRHERRLVKGGSVRFYRK